MSEELFQNQYRVSSARAGWHDYNGGMYFVTICTKGKEHSFGIIMNGDVNHFCRDGARPVSTKGPTMILSRIGEYAEEQIRKVTFHYPYAEIPLWVIMPNHIHAVVIIDGKKTPHDKRIIDYVQAKNVETFHETSLQESIRIATKMQSWLSVVIRLFKQSVTRYANKNNIPFAWQPRFYDRIIRNTNEMNNIAKYIEENVAKWAYDEFYGQ